MDGIGAASAVIGILQVGFSLAQAIHDTVSGYKGAREDLRKLARDIDRTLYVVSRLETLISEGDKNGSFDTGGLEVMRECHKHTEQIVEALVLLLTDTGVSYQTGTDIKPSDLVITRFNRISWLGRKADVKEKQEELKDIYLEVNTIINLRDAIQAKPGAEQDAKRAMAVESERRRRKRIQLRRKAQKEKTKSRSRPVVEDAQSVISAGQLRSTEASPKPKNLRVVEPESCASSRESISVGKDGIGNHATERVTISGNMITDKIAGDTTSKHNNPHHKTANRKKTGRASQPGTKSTQLERPFSPTRSHHEDQDKQHNTHQAVIKRFKQETKDTISALSGEAHDTLKRAVPFARHETTKREIRQFVESEYQKRWAARFGEWLPGTNLDLRMTPDLPPLDIDSTKPRKWSLRKKQNTSPSSALRLLGIPDRAHFLVIEQQDDKKASVTRLNAPDRSQSVDIRVTGLIWAELKPKTRDSIWRSLRSELPLPRGYHWSLHGANYTNAPRLFSRLFARTVSADFMHFNRCKDGCIVAFVALHSHVDEDISSELGEDIKRGGKGKKTLSKKTEGRGVTFSGEGEGDFQDHSSPWPQMYQMPAPDPFSGISHMSGALPMDHFQPQAEEQSHDPPLADQWDAKPSRTFDASRRTFVDYDKSYARDARRPSEISSLEARVTIVPDILEESISASSDTTAPRAVMQKTMSHTRPFDHRAETVSTSSASMTRYGRRDRAHNPRAEHNDQSHRHSPAGSSQGDDADTQDLSDGSVDDAELYDQLLRRYTGHGLRGTTNADESGRENFDNGIVIISNDDGDDDEHDETNED